jgi:hypothetical protein
MAPGRIAKSEALALKGGRLRAAVGTLRICGRKGGIALSAGTGRRTDQEAEQENPGNSDHFKVPHLIG